ncbi:MAG: hypothetical protein C0595_05775 [Marinilabiliales bacterium]|nr:MAG: hypothetical protein C0595_05775 [Marinilabiliales bacterium]
MSKLAHNLYIGLMTSIVFIVTIYIIYLGYDYYNTGIEERFYSEGHDVLKPSGSFGHGYGIIGSLFMIIGVSSYMMRKRVRAMQKWGLLKHWLEFHIFLCTLGPILVLFHTSFKFGGIVSISFWSMVAVFASGVIGRFIYIQIPRSIEGRELSLNEVKGMKTDINSLLKNNYNIEDDRLNIIVYTVESRSNIKANNVFSLFLKKYFNDLGNIRKLKQVIKESKISQAESKNILQLVKNEVSLNRRIDRLNTMQNLFKYWHVAHLPFAIIMLVIMIIHVGVTLTFGYRWIF